MGSKANTREKVRAQNEERGICRKMVTVAGFCLALFIIKVCYIL